MTFAGQVDEESAKAQLETFFSFHPEDQYVELDTAFMYCETKTEQMLGEILTEEQRCRMVIATKANPGHKGGLSAQSISTQFTTSLANMKMDKVDIFYLHWPDPKTPLDQSLKRVNDLYKQGKFRELGLSNYSATQVEEILKICEAKGYVRPTVYQGMYNALTRAVEPELIPLLRQHGIRFYVYNPLAGGLLTGKYTSTEEKPQESTRFDATTIAGKRYQARYWKKCFFDALAIIKAAVDSHAPGRSLADISLTWLHHHSILNRDAFDAIIIGQTGISHLQTNLSSGTQGETPQTLPKEILEAIDQAWELVKPECPTYWR
jgi:aflatoxin B1 aldehyde reductase